MISIAIKNGILIILVILIIHFIIQNNTMETFNMPSVILDESKAQSIVCENDKFDFDDNTNNVSDNAHIEVIDEQEILDFIKNEETKVNTDFISSDVVKKIVPQNNAVPRMDETEAKELSNLGTFDGGASVGGLSYSLI